VILVELINHIVVLKTSNIINFDKMKIHKNIIGADVKIFGDILEDEALVQI
jgi:hypothetical protein